MLIRLLHGLFSHPGRPVGRRLCFPYSGSRSGHSAPETALGLALRFCRSHLSAGIRGPTLVLGIPLLGTSRVRIDDLGGNRDSRWRTGCQTSCLVCAGSQGRVNVDNRVARQKAGNRRDWEKSALQVPTRLRTFSLKSSAPLVSGATVYAHREHSKDHEPEHDGQPDDEGQ